MAECNGNFFVQNGQLKNASEFDTSFIYGPDYVYEVFRVIQGIPLFLEDHLQRLADTCKISGFSLPVDSSGLYNHIQLLINNNSLNEGNIKLVLLKEDNSTMHVLVYINEHQYPSENDYDAGVDVALFSGERYTPNAKIMDVRLRNANNLMKSEKDVYETLLVDKNSCITEGSRSNVFFVKDHRLITPPLADVLPGVTRKHVMEVCRQQGIEVLEEKVPSRSLVIMEGLFITGTSRKVLPVRKVDGLDFDPKHPLILKVRKAFDEKISAYLASFSK